MKPKEKHCRVDLTLGESDILCQVLLRAMQDAGGVNKQPPVVQVLYVKLAKANDRLRYK